MPPDALEKQKFLFSLFGFSVRLQEQKMTRSGGMESMTPLSGGLLPDVCVDLFFTLLVTVSALSIRSVFPAQKLLSSVLPPPPTMGCVCNPPYTPKSIKRSHSIVSCSHRVCALGEPYNCLIKPRMDWRKMEEGGNVNK
jgi:hypothetical protein